MAIQLDALINTIKQNDPKLKKIATNLEIFCHLYLVKTIIYVKPHTCVIVDHLALDDLALERLLTAIQENPYVGALLTPGSDITTLGFERIANFLISPQCVLTLLSLNSVQVGDIGATHIASALTSNSTLVVLDLPNSQIGDSGASELAVMLETNTTLVKLSLYGNQIGPVGGVRVAQMLTLNSTLYHLDIAKNPLESDGASSIISSLKTNTSISVISLSRCELGVENISSISEVLSVNSSLLELDLSGNPFGDAGFDEITKILSINSTLTFLNLTDCPVGLNSFSKFAVALQSNTSLISFNMAHPSVTSEHLDHMISALEFNYTLEDGYLKFVDGDTSLDEKDMILKIYKKYEMNKNNKKYRYQTLFQLLFEVLDFIIPTTSPHLLESNQRNSNIYLN